MDLTTDMPLYVLMLAHAFKELNQCKRWKNVVSVAHFYISKQMNTFVQTRITGLPCDNRLGCCNSSPTRRHHACLIMTGHLKCLQPSPLQTAHRGIPGEQKLQHDS